MDGMKPNEGEKGVGKFILKGGEVGETGLIEHPPPISADNLFFKIL